MKSRIQTVVVASCLLLAVPAFAQSTKSTAKAEAAAPKGELLPITEKEAAWAAEARKAYPLKACVVSGEALGSMGDPAEYIYRVKGKPDRLVRFCCGGCDEDFLSQPEAHLAKLNKNAKGQSAPQGEAKGHHKESGHGHDKKH